MAYTPIPTIVAGERWDEDDIQLYIIDNLNFLNSQLGGGPGETFDVDELVVGGPGGVLQGLQLTTGDLVVGGATAPVAFPVGPNGQVLMASGGNLGYGVIEAGADAVDVVLYG